MKWEMKLREARDDSEAKGMKKGLEKGLTLRSQNPILHVNNFFDSTTHHSLII